jgi:hypothetical protein
LHQLWQQKIYLLVDKHTNVQFPNTTFADFIGRGGNSTSACSNGLRTIMAVDNRVVRVGCFGAPYAGELELGYHHGFWNVLSRKRLLQVISKVEATGIKVL